MRYAALSYGYGVAPECVSGTVVGVFPHACVIALDGGGAASLVRSDTGNLPGGIVLDAPAAFDFGATDPQGRVYVRGGILRFRSAELSVDLRPARPWRSDLRALDLDLRRRPSLRAVDAATRILLSDGRAGPLVRAEGARIVALMESVSRLDADAAGDAASRLIGLGEGTTPAGDDFLVGFLGGLWAAASNDTARAGFASGLGHRVAAMKTRTSWLSGCYLAAAAVGEVSERLTALLSGLASGDGVEAVRAARAGIAVGHSSGACAVLGLLVGCGVWDVPRRGVDNFGIATTPEPLPTVPA